MVYSYRSIKLRILSPSVIIQYHLDWKQNGWPKRKIVAQYRAKLVLTTKSTDKLHIRRNRINACWHLQNSLQIIGMPIQNNLLLKSPMNLNINYVKLSQFDPIKLKT